MTYSLKEITEINHQSILKKIGGLNTYYSLYSCFNFEGQLTNVSGRMSHKLISKAISYFILKCGLKLVLPTVQYGLSGKPVETA